MTRGNRIGLLTSSFLLPLLSALLRRVVVNVFGGGQGLTRAGAHWIEHGLQLLATFEKLLAVVHVTLMLVLLAQGSR